MRRYWITPLLLLGCSNAAGIAATSVPSRPIGGSTVIYVLRVAPLPGWAAVYQAVELCAKRKGDYGAIEWYETGHSWRGEGGTTMGLWRHNGRGKPEIILIAGDTTYLRHEILHDILYRSGWRPDPVKVPPDPNRLHPAKYFGSEPGKCAIR